MERRGIRKGPNQRDCFLILNQITKTYTKYQIYEVISRKREQNK